MLQLVETQGACLLSGFAVRILYAPERLANSQIAGWVRKTQRQMKLSECRNPALEGVRAWLGTGSKGTIAPLLKQWRQEQASFLKDQETALPPDLLNVIHGLWAGLKSKSEQLIADEQSRHARQWERSEANNRDLTQRLQSAEQKNKLLREEVETLEKRIAALRDENQTIKQRVEFLSGKNGGLQQRITDHASTIATLKDQAKLSYENLEHFRLSVQQQREQDRLEQDQQRNQWQQQEQIAQEKMAQLSLKNSELTQNLDDALREKKALFQNEQLLEQRLATATAEHQHVAQENEQLSKTNLKLMKEKDDAANTLIEAQREVTRLERTLHAMQRQVSQYDALIQTLQVIKNKLETQTVI